MKVNNLASLIQDWESWAATADQTNNGWQSDYPHWKKLMHAAIGAMDEGQTDIAAIEKCWQITEEDEVLADHVKGAPERYLNLLTRLAQSQHRDVRWQVYASLEDAGPVAIPILERGTIDNDAYVRRRAVLALAKIAPEIVRRHLHEYEHDSDAYNRTVFARLKGDGSAD